MIIRWPGVSKSNSECNFPVTSTDFYPTILEMAKIPLLPDQHIDGISMAPLLKGEEKLSRDAIFWHYPHYGNQGGGPGSAIRAGEYKLIENFEDGHLELYNLDTDIGETENLIDSEPDIAESLHAQLIKWRLEVDARLPSNNPEFQPK